jgi:hypothetical protein
MVIFPKTVLTVIKILVYYSIFNSGNFLSRDYQTKFVELLVSQTREY